jgi:DNA-binding NarL/FixJ family response regulator
VLLVEDDHLQAKDLRLVLESDLNAEVQTMSTEYDFVRGFQAIVDNPPDFAILDRMLRWSSPSRDMQEPPVDSQDPEGAGVRCALRLRQEPRTAEMTHVILYSVLGDDGDTQGFDTVVKEGEFENLIARIVQVQSSKND